MANKYQENQNNKDNKFNKNQDIYRNDSKLNDKNNYIIYELNNTFDDKDKDVLNESENNKTNNNKTNNNNNSFVSKTINNKLENKNKDSKRK